MATKRVKKSAPKNNLEFGVLSMLCLVVTTMKGTTRKCIAWLPTDLPLLQDAVAQVEDGSRKDWMIYAEKDEKGKPKITAFETPEKVLALYEALTEAEKAAEYGSAMWLACKSAREAMRGAKGYKAKAGAKAIYRLTVKSNPIS